ncbi:class I SAM-dependent methyltransferase [Alkalihalobacterium chitinilyticum]|uniref:Class I SAM-dependent methyltransferase n=1 Tax=Alkalihalobacterium chitinilyticum TaxID=2980103 RepID=A0ABT5VEV7_9BACI|nr:class I SAM-dependent methyltransferase [Alkalihalobacterium chitinilyticum]MDE5412739.1 class I SAM-dependent methyltransferase [Alkalihalobacterium chitinilyticum]
MFKEWKRVWEARKWMKKNEGFLPTWHAYIGFKMKLFDELAKGKTLTELQQSTSMDEQLLTCWVDVGTVIGHLYIGDNQKIYPTKHMITYFSATSRYSVGELLREMMELHIPTLLNYPHLLTNEAARKNYDHDGFGQTVAETSALIEKFAFPKVKKKIKKSKATSVLDIGCGHAGYLVRLSKLYKNKEFTGIDINRSVVDEAQKKVKENKISNVNIYQKDITTGDKINQAFDYIMMNNLLHYFSREGREELFQLTYDSLEKNGSLTIITPLYLSKNGKAFSVAFNSFMTAHENLHPIPTEDELRVYAQNTGYYIDEITPVVKEGSWYMIAMKKEA